MRACVRALLRACVYVCVRACVCVYVCVVVGGGGGGEIPTTHDTDDCSYFSVADTSGINAIGPGHTLLLS